jgi:branched-chain amino acid aminotransferase
MILLNGKPLQDNEAHIPIDDRGFRFGDGLFEKMIFAGGNIYQLDFHLRRLVKGLVELRINFDIKLLRPHLEAIVREFKAGYIKLTITRGAAGNDYMPIAATPTWLIEVSPLRYPEFKTLRLIVSRYTRPSITNFPTNIKTLQGLSSTLSLLQARDEGANEAIMLNYQGFVTSCAAANIFVVKGQIISTPQLDSGCVEGAIRNRILNLKLPGMMLNQRLVSLEDIINADEVFVTSVDNIVLPVGSISGMGSYRDHLVAKTIYNIIGLTNLVLE